MGHFSTTAAYQVTDGSLSGTASKPELICPPIPQKAVMSLSSSDGYPCKRNEVSVLVNLQFLLASVSMGVFDPILVVGISRHT
jgi:hypothetical protein